MEMEFEVTVEFAEKIEPGEPVNDDGTPASNPSRVDPALTQDYMNRLIRGIAKVATVEATEAGLNLGGLHIQRVAAD